MWYSSLTLRRSRREHPPWWTSPPHQKKYSISIFLSIVVLPHGYGSLRAILVWPLVSGSFMPEGRGLKYKIGSVGCLWRYRIVSIPPILTFVSSLLFCGRVCLRVSLLSLTNFCNHVCPVTCGGDLCQPCARPAGWNKHCREASFDAHAGLHQGWLMHHGEHIGCPRCEYQTPSPDNQPELFINTRLSPTGGGLTSRRATPTATMATSGTKRLARTARPAPPTAPSTAPTTRRPTASPPRPLAPSSSSL